VTARSAASVITNLGIEMKKVIIIALLALVAARSDAASISTTTCPGAGCVTIDIAGNGTLGIQITGTFVGTITFQSSVDNSTYVSLRAISVADTTSTLITSTTTTGIFSANVAGMSSARVVFTAYTSGTATVSLRLSQRYSSLSSGGGGAATTPGGSTTQLQFNDAASFGGSLLTYNKTLQTYSMVTKLPNIDASALTAPVLAGAGAGNLTNGVYRYKLTQLDNDGNETAAITPTTTVTVTDATMNGQVVVSQPFNCNGYSPRYNLYRTVANGSVYKFVALLDYTCSLTYTDNIADASLGANAPSTNTTSIMVSWNGTKFVGPNDQTSNGTFTQELGDGTKGVELTLPPTQIAGGSGFDIIGQDSVLAGGTLLLKSGQSATANGGYFYLYGGNGATVGGHIYSAAGDGTTNGGDWSSYAGNGTTSGVWRAGIGGPAGAHIIITGTNTNITPTLSVAGNPMLPVLTGTTGAIGGGALAAGACTSGNVTVTGATTSMIAIAGPVTYPGDGTDWSAYVSAANTVTVKVCALVVITPTSTTYNVRVIQ